MTESDNNVADGNLTQKEIIQLLLHNAQHMATREEVKLDIKELKAELKEDNKELKKDIRRVEASLKEDILKVESSLKEDISKVDAKFDKIQWLIIATIVTVLSKDYLFTLLETSTK